MIISHQADSGSHLLKKQVLTGSLLSLLGLVARCPGQVGRGCDRGGRGAWLGQRRHAGASGWLSVSPQETSIPEELMVTVVKPGLPTLADLHVLLPPPRPTRKRSLTSDKVPPAATGPGAPRTA